MSSDEWRRNAENLREPNLSENLILFERLREIGERHDASPAEVAIAWTLRHPAVTAAIVGGHRPDQVDDGVVGAADRELSDEEVQEIEGFVGENRQHCGHTCSVGAWAREPVPPNTG
jgi:aryl-alcohol dehydrogenase-like predicted oxidoreductase